MTRELGSKQNQIKPRNNVPMITLSTLKERGWTDGLVSRFLGDPDKLATNPHYRSGPKMRLYALDRIEEAEEAEAAKEALGRVLEQRQRRSDAALKASAAKRQSLMEEIESIRIEIPKHDIEELVICAIYHYNNRMEQRGTYDRTADIQSDANFIKRITANFIRHQMINYDNICAQLSGKIGNDEAYFRFKSRVMEEIFKIYPDLKD